MAKVGIVVFGAVAGIGLAIGEFVVPKTVTMTEEINASPEIVYDTIMDISSYGEWNSIISSVEPQDVDISLPDARFKLVTRNKQVSLMRTRLAIRPQPNGSGVIVFASVRPLIFRAIIPSPARTFVLRRSGNGKCTILETYETYKGIGSSLSSFKSKSLLKDMIPFVKCEAERRAKLPLS